MTESSIDESNNTAIDAIVQVLTGCQSILFITGAGVSADSGVPTYRGIGGLYNVDTTAEGYAIEEVLSAEMFARDPALTWKYLAQIGLAAQDAKHNRAHEVIAEIEAHFDRVWTLTQNVDSFHRSAGSKNLIEAHGNMNSFVEINPSETVISSLVDYRVTLGAAESLNEIWRRFNQQ